MTPPLRIGICVPIFPQRSETFIVTNVLKLVEAGLDVHVFAARPSHDWDAVEVLRGRDDVRARVHLLPSFGGLGDVVTRVLPDTLTAIRRHPVAFARFVAHNWRARRETTYGFLRSLYLRVHFVGHELDILHVELDSQGIGIIDLKRYLGCRILCSWRGTLQSLSVFDRDPRLVSYIFEHVDGHHFTSRFLERNTRELGLPADVPTWLIEPAIDLHLFRPPTLHEERTRDVPLRVISIGWLSWENGHEIAIDAIARVRAAGIPVEFTIYGSGTYEEAIRYAIHQLGLGDSVRLGGVLGREQMVEVYANADVLLHAALVEGLSNVVIEAQAMQLPVVTSDSGGLPENVEHEVTGYVVPRCDPEALAVRLIELAKDPALRRRFGSAGRRRALERFDLEHQADKFIRLYTELAGMPHRA